MAREMVVLKTHTFVSNHKVEIDIKSLPLLHVCTNLMDIYYIIISFNLKLETRIYKCLKPSEHYKY